ncbi:MULTISPECIES: L-threonylcarbamoyladenylate synthase [unclassified Pseudoalteromonas]|uniref:L-threonylcarbamoyladenylate synthase n=1 Tax=unclassified Pseudoalteromonas TaxID=194690 RepID=UPI0016010C94|nr:MULTISPECIES: L-threonylcarbamoyladenylate synthase [unclassified Pseudoalteromonas]MBB1307918.1 threonylcarbamoyl-AMP synthase [Pseudoalteromonas sp. SR41-8]MBB1398531.1 threonylcarbamoyl-AMP synthase [Pseudoalteromonas sp. SG44-8]MBB1409937.1 threonylcarbamoyl-AMP synthase [Pseudoalteromonas sp. SG44-17]
MTPFNSTKMLSGEQGIVDAISLLKSGQCVALPTETVYGLAADATIPSAVLKIFAAKKRPESHPLIVHIPDQSHLTRWAEQLPACVKPLADAFWPGPLTMILKAKTGLNNPVTGGLHTIGLRVPANALFLKILTELDTGLAAPSANSYKQLSPIAPEQVINDLNGRIAAVLDGGKCSYGIESTILEVTDQTLRILRPGPISAVEIEQVTGLTVAVPLKHNEIVPGNVSAHYQPNTPTTLISLEQLITEINEHDNDKTHYLVYSKTAIDALLFKHVPINNITCLAEEPHDYAKNLYDSLHQIDKHSCLTILVEQPPQEQAWSAVNDRLSRAASTYIG